MRLLHLLGGLLAAASIGLIAGCHDATAPGQPNVSFDGAHARARLEPMAKIFDQEIFRSFEAAESFFEAYFRSGGGVPDAVKGKTLVYDAVTRSYVVDPSATGVPPGEVRFVLYGWDAANGQPSMPLNRIGYVDLADAAGGVGAPQLVEVIVFRERPFLVAADFVVMHRSDAGVNQFGIEGSATDGFTVALVELNGTESGTDGDHHLVYKTELSTSPGDVSTVETLTSDQATASQSGKLDLLYDGHKLTDESVASGAEVRFDEMLYARILSPRTLTDQTQYLRPDGSALPQQEVVDLNALLERAVVANFFWVSLAWP